MKYRFIDQFTGGNLSSMLLIPTKSTPTRLRAFIGELPAACCLQCNVHCLKYEGLSLTCTQTESPSNGRSRFDRQIWFCQKGEGSRISGVIHSWQIVQRNFSPFSLLVWYTNPAFNPTKSHRGRESLNTTKNRGRFALTSRQLHQCEGGYIRCPPPQTANSPHWYKHPMQLHLYIHLFLNLISHIVSYHS